MYQQLNSPWPGRNKHQKTVGINMLHWFMVGKEGEIYNAGTQQIFIGINTQNIPV